MRFDLYKHGYNATLLKKELAPEHVDAALQSNYIFVKKRILVKSKQPVEVRQETRICTK